MTPTKIDSSDAKLDNAWLQEHRRAYVGQWVALRDGVLIASGLEISEVRSQARGYLGEGRSYLLIKIFGIVG